MPAQNKDQRQALRSMAAGFILMVGLTTSAFASMAGKCPQIILDGFTWHPVGSGWENTTCWQFGIQPWVETYCATHEYRNYENEFGFALRYNCTTEQWG